MFAWPHLELTDYERRYVRPYRTKDKPGVLKRIYQANLISIADPGAGFPAVRFSDQVQISRRSRIFGLTFLGDTYAWRLGIRTSSGESFTNPEPRTALEPLVSSMAPGTFYNAEAHIGEPPIFEQQVFDTVNQHVSAEWRNQRMVAMMIDPNWELLPNETLIFTGTLAQTLDPASDKRFLSIGVHVWEFPGMLTEGE